MTSDPVPTPIEIVRKLICAPIQANDEKFYSAWLADPIGFANSVADQAGADLGLRSTLVWLSDHWAAKFAVGDHDAVA